MAAGAIGSALLSGSSNAGSSALGSWLGNTSRESLNKNITKTNFKIQKKYDEWTQEQDKAYNKWWQNYLYGLQNNEYYELSKKYATNTAKWAVDGLKNAGLNPILAAGNYNMSSNLGNASPASNPSASTGKGSVRGPAVSSGGSAGPVNLAAMSQIAATAKNNERTEAETDNIKADTDLKKMGGTDFGRNLVAIGTMLDGLGLKKPLVDLTKKAATWLTNQLGTPPSGGSTAKQDAADEALKRKADEIYNPSTDAAYRGIIDDETLDKINAAGHSRDAGKSPAERERERRLLNGRRIMRQRQYNGGRANDF
jgi:hypothetical protein